jgi:hypothetical protein
VDKKLPEDSPWAANHPSIPSIPSIHPIHPIPSIHDEPSRAEPRRAEPSRAEPGRAEPSRGPRRPQATPPAAPAPPPLPRKVIPYSVFGKSVSFLPHLPTFLRISINRHSSSILGVSLTSPLVHLKTCQKRPKVFHFIAPSTFVVQNEQPSQYFGMFCSKPP